MRERLDQRVFGALRWVDHLTGQPIRRALEVVSSQARFRRNASDLAVIVSAERFASYAATLLPPLPGPDPALPAPPVRIAGKVADPLGEYLPRMFSFELPRGPRASHPWPADSIFRPVEVALLPGAAARLAAGWAEVRVTARKAGGGVFPNVLVRVRGDLEDGEGVRLLGVGMSDFRGEALVALTSVPLYQPHPVTGKMAPTEVDLIVELVPPPAGQTVVDWTDLLETPVAAANSHTGRRLDERRLLSLEFTVTA